MGEPRIVMSRPFPTIAPVADPLQLTLSTRLMPPPTASTPDGHQIQWFDTGEAFLNAQVEAIACARHRVRLEQYIYAASPIGDRFLEAFTAAARRGVKVQLLIDSLGSRALPASYFDVLRQAGGEVLWFNPLRWRLFSFRDHRKLLVIDDTMAYVGGCNIAEEYAGDGVTHGWRDGGVSVNGPIVARLIELFEGQWERAPQQMWKVRKHAFSGWMKPTENVSLLLQRPGLRQRGFQQALREDLRHARHVAITAAYFLPTRRLRRSLMAAAHHAQLRLLLPAHSDVPMLQVATRSLYRRLQRHSAKIYEYEPQNPHAKIIVIDDIVYVGSANLDPRSLAINFEIVLRIQSRELAQAALQSFECDLQHSVEVPRVKRRAHWWRRLKQRLAYLLFGRLDLAVAQLLLRRVEAAGPDGNRVRRSGFSVSSSGQP
jgi:cardiolipin synthase